jgi:phage baseplate assembly protein W
MSDYTFQDLDSKFRINSFTDDISVQRDLNSIRQSVTNLVLTRKDERPFSSANAGAGLSDLFFELANDSMSAKKIFIKEETKRIINKYEPRVIFKDFKITNPNNTPNSINVELSYDVVAFDTDPNVQSNVVDGVNLTLER